MISLLDDICRGVGYLSVLARVGVVLLCVFAAAMPIIALVGIVLMVRGNSRSNKVDNYNEAVVQYQAGPLDVWDGATFSIRPRGQTVWTNLTKTSVPVPISGSKSGVAETNHVSFSAPNIDILSTEDSTNLPGKYQITVRAQSAFGAAREVLLTGPLSDTVVAFLSCSSCSLPTLTTQCLSSYSGNTQSTQCPPSAGTASRVCANCHYTAYISNLCVPLRYDRNDDSWKRPTSTDLTSCAFPFTSQQFAATTAVLSPVTFRSSLDPLIALQKELDGSTDFGITTASQQAIGGGLLGGSLVVMLLICIGVCCCLRYFGIKAEEDPTFVDTSNDLPGAAARRQSQSRSGRHDRYAEETVLAEVVTYHPPAGRDPAAGPATGEVIVPIGRTGGRVTARATEDIAHDSSDSSSDSPRS